MSPSIERRTRAVSSGSDVAVTGIARFIGRQASIVPAWMPVCAAGFRNDTGRIHPARDELLRAAAVLAGRGQRLMRLSQCRRHTRLLGVQGLRHALAEAV